VFLVMLPAARGMFVHEDGPLWHRFPGRPASEFGRLNETASRWKEVKQPID
jgi:hypothetical protein